MVLISRLWNNSFIKSSYYSVLGGVFSKGFSLIGTILIARNLGKDLFGEIGVITTTLLLIAPFCSLGISYSANKIISQDVQNSIKTNEIINVSLITTVILSLIFWMVIILVYWIVTSLYGADAGTLLNDNFNYPLVFLVGFYLFLLVNVNTLVGIYTGMDRLRSVAIFQCVAGLLSVPLYYYLTLYIGILGAFLAFVLVQLSFLILLIYGLRDRIYEYLRSPFSNFLNCLREILHLGVPLGLSDGVYGISNWLIIILLLTRGGTGEVGLFNGAAQWLMFIVFLPGSMSTVLLSYLSKSISYNNNQSNHFKLLKYNLIIVSIFSLIFTILFVIFSDLISKLYGDEFNGISEVIAILVLSAVPITITNILFQGFISHHKPTLVLIFRVLSQLTTLLLAYFLLTGVNSALHLGVYRFVGVTAVLILSGFTYYYMFYREWKGANWYFTL